MSALSEPGDDLVRRGLEVHGLRLGRGVLRLMFGWLKPEFIGPKDCPIIRRWTIWDRNWKVLLHHFPANMEDRPLHDHPWSFFTFVLWGSYEDIGYSKDEVVQAPTVRYRPACHLHRTRTGKHGAWTVVIAMPKSRGWGFFRDGKWWPFREYEEKYGFRDRCD